MRTSRGNCLMSMLSVSSLKRLSVTSVLFEPYRYRISIFIFSVFGLARLSINLVKSCRNIALAICLMRIRFNVRIMRRFSSSKASDSTLSKKDKTVSLPEAELLECS